jgi:rhomboid protease GluP
MYALLYIGVLLEPQMGRLRFLAAYLLTGIMASLTSLYWHPNIISAGASGAIFGMYGVFLALLTTNLIDKTRRRALLASIVVFVAFNLLYGTSKGVDNAAHVGGLVSGILIGYLFYPGLRRPDNPRLGYSAVVLATLLVGTVAVVAFKRIPNDYGLYQRKMDAFARLERKALAVLQPPEGNLSKAAWLNSIRDSGNYYWNKSIRVLDETSQLDVSEQLKRQTDVLIRYCNLRILSYNYIYRKMTDSASSGEDSVAYFNSQISGLLESLKKKD